MVLVASDGDDLRLQQLSLPSMTCQAVAVITRLLLSSDDPLVLSSGLAAYAALCDAALRLSCNGSDLAEDELLSWMKEDGGSCSVMNVMLRCFYFPAAHTVCVAAIRAMKSVCTSLLHHYNGNFTDAKIINIVFCMLQLVFDTSQRGGAGGGADMPLECDQMKRFNACMSVRLNCASTFPWLLLFARIDASDCVRDDALSPAMSSATASKLHHFMMRCMFLGESSIFALEPKTRSDSRAE
jgi:hypothetical protein